MTEPKRRFFSGDTLQQALVQAANHFNLGPDEISYRSIEKRHGFLKAPRRVVIEVDPDAPRRSADEQPAPLPAGPTRAPVYAQSVETAASRRMAVSTPSPASPEAPPPPPREGRPAGEGRPEGRGDRDRRGPRRRDDRGPRRDDRGLRRSDDRGPRRPGDRGPARATERSVGSRVEPAGPQLPASLPAPPLERQAWGPPVRTARPPERPRAEPRSEPHFGGDEPEIDLDDSLIVLPERPRPVGDRYPVASGPVAEAAEKGLGLLLGVSNLRLAPRIHQGEGRLEIDLSGEDADFCFDEEGEVLRAIEHLLPRVIRALSGEAIPCRVDCESFHEIREEQLRSLAQRVAAEVRRRGRARTLEPMNPADRRIVHMTLADDPGVETESDGEGYFKRIVVRPV